MDAIRPGGRRRYRASIRGCDHDDRVGDRVVVTGDVFAGAVDRLLHDPHPLAESWVDAIMRAQMQEPPRARVIP